MIAKNWYILSAPLRAAAAATRALDLVTRASRTDLFESSLVWPLDGMFAELVLCEVLVTLAAL